MLIKLVTNKGVQHVDCDGGKNRPGDLEPGPIVFAEHFATLTNTGSLYEPVRFENVGYTDASKCYEKENQNETDQRLLHTNSPSTIILLRMTDENRPLRSECKSGLRSPAGIWRQN
jgi:hypothetical protein